MENFKKGNVNNPLISTLREYANSKGVKLTSKEDLTEEDLNDVLHGILAKVEFHEKLTNVLKGEVKPKSEDAINGEQFCDSLKKILVNLFEEVHKLDLFPNDLNLSEFMHEEIDYPIERMKEQTEKTWLRDKLTISLMGHYCTGKTTALNLLFGESFLVNEHENTALATYLTYGNSTDTVTIVDSVGQSQDLTMNQFSLFDYSNGVKDFPFARLFSYMVKENHNEILKNLTIIDTPGLFSTYKGHSIPTMNVVSSSDAIFWFINITNSASKDNLDKISECVGSLPLYIIFSFVDARGTSPDGVDNSIKKIIDIIKKDEKINYKGFLKLGKKEVTRQQFKKEAQNVLRKLANEHEAYIPYTHILAVINFLEDFLVKWRNKLTELIADLDTETDKLLADYKASARTFTTEINNSTSRFNNMIDTFNNRCSGATFCGGASGALCNNINGISDSLKKMISAYNNMDESKLIQYGNGCAQMSSCQDKLDHVSDIISKLVDLKNKLS